MTAVLAEATHIDIEADVRYWEDAIVDDVVDEDGSRIPGREGETWKARIHLASGSIEGWPDGTEARIHYKVCDQGEYWLSREDGQRIAKWKGHYVPARHLNPSGGDDYIVLTVRGDGVVVDWRDVAPDEDRWSPVA